MADTPEEGGAEIDVSSLEAEVSLSSLLTYFNCVQKKPEY